MGHNKILVIALLTVSLGGSALAAGEDDARFAAVPQFAALKAKAYRSVGAQGYVVRTDAFGRVASTSDAHDVDIRSVKYLPQARIAKITLVDRRYTIVIHQDWRHTPKGWEFNNPERGRGATPRP